MNVLLNDADIAEHLARLYFRERFRDDPGPDWVPLQKYIDKISKKAKKTDQPIEADISAITQAVTTSVQLWRDQTAGFYKKTFRPFVNFLSRRFYHEDMDSFAVMDRVKNDVYKTFVERVAQTIDADYHPISRSEYRSSRKPVLIRNIIDNEEILNSRLQKKHPFWFVDTGYTNFLHANKHWHRLVYNNTHHVKKKQKSFPADRLHIFPTFPKPWRADGERILVVESSEMHYQLHGDDINDWRHRILTTLGKYTNKTVEFRSKELDKKSRSNLYQYLDSEDIYCVISDSSAAAIEAIWRGIPTITLRPHISSPVSRWDLGSINNLYRGDIGDWLCCLSYSQFTEAEMCDGTALEATRRFYVN